MPLWEARRSPEDAKEHNANSLIIGPREKEKSAKIKII